MKRINKIIVTNADVEMIKTLWDLYQEDIVSSDAWEFMDFIESVAEGAEYFNGIKIEHEENGIKIKHEEE